MATSNIEVLLRIISKLFTFDVFGVFLLGIKDMGPKSYVCLVFCILVLLLYPAAVISCCILLCYPVYNSRGPNEYTRNCVIFVVFGSGDEL